MYPILVRLGPCSVASYWVAITAAFLVSMWLASRAVRRLPSSAVTPSPRQVVLGFSWGLAGAIVGGRFLYGLLYWEVYRSAPADLFAVWQGGFASYGGLAGAIAAAWLFVKRQRLSFLQTLDRVIPFLALAQAVVRIGCFANGCCFGKPTAGWFAVHFPRHLEPVIPIQLVESLVLTALYLVLRRLQTPPRLHRSGAVFGLFLIGYSVIRFLLEFWRAPQPDMVTWGGLTLNQLVSPAVCLMGAWFLASRRSARFRDASSLD